MAEVSLSDATSRLEMDRVAPRPDHASLSATILRSLEYPPYRAAFYAASVHALVTSPKFVALVQDGRGVLGARDAKKASPAEATANATAAFAAGAAAMGASTAAASLVARALAGSPANVRAAVAAGAAAVEATQAILRATARRAGLHDSAADVVARQMTDSDVKQVVSVAKAARCGPATARPPRTDADAADDGSAPRVVYVSLPRSAGVQRWRAGLYERVAPFGDADLLYARLSESPGEQLTSYLFRAAVASKGALWFVGSSPSKDAAGVASDYDAADAPEAVTASWYAFDGAAWNAADGLKITLMPDSVAAALAKTSKKSARLAAPSALGA